MMFAQIANLPNLYVMVKWVSIELVNAYFWIIHIFIYKCIHKPIEFFFETQADLANLPNLPNFPDKFAELCQH